MKLADLAGKRVAIWGFGREGRAALKAIRSRFAGQSITVFCDADEAAVLRDDAHVVVHTSPPNAEVLSQFDVVIKSPGISPYKAPYTEVSGVRFTSASALWFAENPNARTICVTGTKGKSTVSALIAHLLRKGGRCVALAGNIGLPLLDVLDPPQGPDWWVIELSSFQTRDFDGAPTVAVINNLYEEHLDWHGSAQRYVEDKLRIAERARVVVAPASLTAIKDAIRFGTENGWHVSDGAILRAQRRVLDVATLPIPGKHNAQNVCAALAAIEVAGEDAIAVSEHVHSFRPLPHRLQPLGERDGIRYVNDSISTTPYASVEALRSLSAPTTILVGGFDRGVSWRIFVDYVASHPPVGIVTMGANGSAIANALGAVAQPKFVLRRARTLADALVSAREVTPNGGSIVLSPGAPSFDQFRDYAERGREFARLAGFDASAITQIDGLGIA
ncbi:MAG TPA: UDP-N-acetylmuramoyl-L-alanine--D-glutamate ligase [Rudaea sp.]|jgi:UDP-N-acetylmuramoylalanine--D-glutamate ligase|nr:UDP-N-acetylmuramoyl-L-alanine--D-glutamate ligase [Rudaea sp.]